MNDLILGYVRITCYAAIACFNILVASNVRGEKLGEFREYAESLSSIVQQLNEEADKFLGTEI